MNRKQLLQPVDVAAVRAEIRGYLLAKFLPGDPEESLRDDDLLFEGGIVDSAGVLALIGHLEERYDLEVPEADLFPENFATVERVAAYVARRLAGR